MFVEKAQTLCHRRQETARLPGQGSLGFHQQSKLAAICYSLCLRLVGAVATSPRAEPTLGGLFIVSRYGSILRKQQQRYTSEDTSNCTGPRRFAAGVPHEWPTRTRGRDGTSTAASSYCIVGSLVRSPRTWPMVSSSPLISASGREDGKPLIVIMATMAEKFLWNLLLQKVGGASLGGERERQSCRERERQRRAAKEHREVRQLRQML